MTIYKSASFIETYTGRAFYPLEPKIEALSIIDIAHALSNQCRYSGHTAFFYPVAQHCSLLADFVVRNGGRPIDALQILMHDAAEAYIVDVPRPVKKSMPNYREWDDHLSGLIRQWMGFEGPEPEWIRALDGRIIADERAQLLTRSPNDWGMRANSPLGIGIQPWTPEDAERVFLTQYANYSKAVDGKDWYLNEDWGIPQKIYHATGSDSAEIADVMEVDIRGGVARIKRRDETGIMVRDPSKGQMPMPDYEWHHGNYTLETRK